MPIDYQQVHEKILQVGLGARQRRERLEHRRAQARELFHALSSELDDLRSKLESAVVHDPNLRCAVPVIEPLNSSNPPPKEIPPATLIAADGSQVNPDRHAAVQFGLVNVGAISMRLNSGEAPKVTTDTHLMYGDDLFPNETPLTEGLVALRRDLAERSNLETLSREVQGPVVTFTDGPIELWGAQGEDPKTYADFVERHKAVLSRLQSRGVITAGYVDKPSANLVLRLLEIALADGDQVRNLREFHPLRGVTDRWLFSAIHNPLLSPGHRSAVFRIQSGSRRNYQGDIELHFFYLNVGTQGHPWPVRVEIPAWVANDMDKLDLLHGVLVEQCQIMGSRPYPYLLHRAHETALVKPEEKQQIEQLLTMELFRNEEEVDVMSNKGSAKGLMGRTRN
jgi:hypothetical protein